MITKDGRDTPIERLTPENYIVPKGEEKDYHAVIEVKAFNPNTGIKISRPRVQKFGRKIFESHVLASLKKQGYTVTILHDPTKWLEEQAAKKAEAAKAAAEAKAKAEQERFDAAVAAAVAKEMAKREAAEKAANGDNKAEAAKEQKPSRSGKSKE